MQDKIGVLRVLGDVLLNCGANDVDLEVAVSGPMESGLCEGGREAHMAQFFGNLRVVQRENISGQTVV
jgi:hypothetical protein